MDQTQTLGMSVIAPAAAAPVRLVPIKRATADFGALPLPDSAHGLDVAPDRASVWSSLRNGPLRVAIIGSGNWGTATAKIMAENTAKSYLFHKQVNMYVYEEMFQGKKLTEIINTEHENKKYLPGIKLPSNLVAFADAREAAKGANILVFCLPHQFVPNVCKTLKGHIGKFCKGISLIKGLICRNGKAELISAEIGKMLNIDMCVLSGANVANDIGLGQFSETTIGYSDLETASLMQQLFDTPYFRVNLVRDIPGVEVCGALKNIVALAAGFSDGLGYGSNTKAAIVRMGMVEMRKFAHTFFEGVLEETFFDSCGFADVITTCYGGRNRKSAEAFVKTGKSWKQLEQDLLGGQKIQGTGTAEEVYEVLRANNLLDEFPLFQTTYRIAFKGANPKEIVTIFMSETPRPLEQYGSPKLLLKLASQSAPAPAPKPTGKAKL